MNSAEQKLPNTLETLEALLRPHHETAEIETVKRAYAFAEAAHRGQKRATGEPYIVHPLATAITLAEMHLSTPIIVAGLLHDVPEDTSHTLEEIEQAFGADVSNMVSGITKLSKIKYRGIERYMENLRKMFLAMASDVRVVFIKFADRLNNLETLDALPPKKQERIALESLELYAPIANRLGMGEIKGRLEDSAFKYIQPKEYVWVKELAKTAREDKSEYLQRVIRLTKDLLKTSGIQCLDVHGRAKHLYSLYRKLLKHERNIAHVYDLIAMRVIVENVADCYAALGIIHSRWTPLKGRIKDYIAQPKPNGYRSLHTTVFCEDGEIVEFQIRTTQMHLESEYGIAAHWSYDEQKYPANGTPIRPTGETTPPQWVYELAHLQNDQQDQKRYMQSLEDLKIDVFRDRIFVFTPRGDVIDLPEESTCIDFAYAIHTDIGNTCVGSKVNEEVVPLHRVLKNGDMVEILVDKSRKSPSLDWLKFARTRHARNKIRQLSRVSISAWIKGILPGSGK